MIHLDMDFFSQALCRRRRLCVLLPDDFSLLPQGGYAVLYLLHGFSDGCDSFLRNSAISRYCEGLPLCIVMPDADNSFYTDMRCGGAYWTHIYTEVPALIHQNFAISPSPAKTFVGGISMGGYGAAKWMLHSPEPCGHIFLFSPVSDVVKLMRQGFGSASAFSAQQMKLENIFQPATLPKSGNDLIHLLKTNTKTLPPVSLYCGKEDFLYEEVEEFSSLLRKAGARLYYTISEGDHSWPTWEGYLRDMAKTLGEILL